MKYFFNLIFILSVLSYSSSAQEDSLKIKDKAPPSGAYLNATFGYGLNASLNIISGEYVYSLRGSFFFQDDGFIVPEISMDGGILFGKVINRDEDHHFIIMAGIAATETNERGPRRQSSGWIDFGGEYLRIKQRVVGIPIEVQYSYHGEIVGIGATLYANINKEQPMFGLGVSFQFGKLY